MTTIDGFVPTQAGAFGGYSACVAERFYAAIARVGDALGVEVHGLAHLPERRALLVGNHPFGWDVAFAIAAVRRATGRTVWSLGEHAWWKFPFLRRLAADVGVVDGTQENAEALLESEQLVLVLPGGLREAVKPRELRYRLLWGHRYGFVRLALRHNAPLVPLASMGADELFDFVGNAYERGLRWLHRPIPIPRPKRLLPLPHRVRLRYVVCEPIAPALLPDELPDSAERRLRREVEGALHEVFERELAARAGIAL